MQKSIKKLFPQDLNKTYAKHGVQRRERLMKGDLREKLQGP